MKKRGVSPIVSTVLLIALVIIIAIILLLWARGFIKEKVLKFDKPAENVCGEIGLRTFVNDDDSMGFSNIGNVPIYRIDLKIEGGGSSRIESLTNEDSSTNPGFSTTIDTSVAMYDSDTKFKIIPVLIGNVKSGGINEFTCPEKYAFEI